MKRFKKTSAVILTIFIAFAAVLGINLVNNLTVEKTDYSFYDDDIPMAFYGYRILCISDYHNAIYHKRVAKIINEAHPDIVVFLGDMVTLDECKSDNLEKLMSEITIDVPVYGVTGNHEEFYEDTRSLVDKFEAMGIDMLNNETVKIEKDGAYIDIIGFSDVGMNDNEIKDSWNLTQIREYIEKNVSKGDFTVYLNHRANMYPLLNDLTGDLMISGHIHGGIVRIPVFGGVFDVEGGFTPEYDAGLYSETGLSMIVSRGADFLPTRPRVFNGPEVVEITLKK